MEEVSIHLGHGASGDATSMEPHVRGLRRRGLQAAAVQLPRGTAERAIAAFLAAAPPGETRIVGGHSFGGRVASLVAAEHPYAGLVLLSYPLHPPGRRERWRERTAHWSRIRCPVLLLGGDRDPFADAGLLREAVTQLAEHELVVYPGVRHGIGSRLEDALDRIAGFAAQVTGAVHSDL